MALIKKVETPKNSSYEDLMGLVLMQKGKIQEIQHELRQANNELKFIEEDLISEIIKNQDLRLLKIDYNALRRG